MKKLISILGTIGIVASSTSSVIACGGHGSSSDDGHDGNLSNLQKQMLDGAELMTKLILAGRHENLNYNVNEILSSYLTPVSTMSYIPQIYKYNDKTIDVASSLNAYKSLLAPTMNSYDRDHFAGVYASYIMGMYDNDFYNNFLSSRSGSNYFDDTMNIAGKFGVNKNDDDNALGYAAGLSKGMHLSNEADRKALAWGIQDNGALSNYLLDKGFDGATPVSTSGTVNPIDPPWLTQGAGGSNGAGYLFYNSVTTMSRSKAAYYYGGTHGAEPTSLDFKFKDSGLSLKDQTDLIKKKTMDSYSNALLENSKDSSELAFGESGTLFTKAASLLNVNGYATSYTGLINAITKSTSGAETLGNLTNLFIPILPDNRSSKHSQILASGLIVKTIEKFWNTDHLKTDIGHNFKDDVLAALKALDSTVDWEKYNGIMYNTKAMPSSDVLSRATDWLLDSESATKVYEMFNQIQTSYKKSNDSDKKTFWDFLFNEKTGLVTRTQTTIVENLGYDKFSSIISKNNGQSGIDLLNILGRSVDSIGRFRDKIIEMNKEFGGYTIDDKDNGTPYKELEPSQKLKFAQDMGWNGSSFAKDSFGEHAYTTLKDSVGSSVFQELLSNFSDTTSEAMKDPHEKLLQYMVGSGDNSWTAKNEAVNADSNMQQGATMSFTLDYNGVGDSTSNADQQTTQIDQSKLDNFNPYQTKIEYQNKVGEEGQLSQDALNKLDSERTSGVVLGKEQLNMSDEDLMKYDGTGMLANIDNNKVHHYYKVEWTNVSDDAYNPYWVISSIHSFNDNDQEFYNIY